MSYLQVIYHEIIFIRLASQIILNLFYIICLARFVWMAENILLLETILLPFQYCFWLRYLEKIYEAVTQKEILPKLLGLIKINFPKTASIAISDRIAQNSSLVRCGQEQTH